MGFCGFRLLFTIVVDVLDAMRCSILPGLVGAAVASIYPPLPPLIDISHIPLLSKCLARHFRVLR
jgi:hypothetical protein